MEKAHAAVNDPICYVHRRPPQIVKIFYTVLSIAAPKIEFLSVIGSPVTRLFPCMLAGTTTGTRLAWTTAYLNKTLGI